MSQSLLENQLALQQQVSSLRALVQGSRNQGLLYALIGSHVVFGCKIVPFSGLYLGLTGDDAADVAASKNPDRSANPVRPEQYSNIANIYGEVLLMPNQNVGVNNNADLKIATAPGTGLYRFDVVYAYVGAAGPGLGIATGTPHATAPVVPAIPQGALALAQVRVDANVTTIAANKITDLRNFNGRLRGAPGNPGAAATVAIGSVASGDTPSVTNSGTNTAATLDFVLPKGDAGTAATVAIGTTTTGAAGSSASVTNSGTSSAAVLNFTVPAGGQGDPGAAATVTVGTVTSGATPSVTNVGSSTAATLDFVLPKGNDGSAATVAIGTVTTGAAGSSVVVTNSGTSSAAVLNFTIPKGADGGVTDGDKGDIVVSVSGSQWLIDPAVVSTFARSYLSLTTAASVRSTLGAEPSLSAGTAAQYYRGDKSWQTLNKAAVGLANVDNTADTDKPVSTEQQAALDAKANLGGANTFSGVQTFGAAVREDYVALAANNIDLALANYFSKAIAGATTLTVSNVPAAPAVASFILELTNGGSAVVTWWSGIKWAGGAAPALTAAGLDLLGFYTRDGGATWRGMMLAKDSK
ncbi:hypothetical protein [Chitinibacter sp. GC72]|uniref:hypothetical protein n=1 Tax=Chitinibacter sp. GC72 TaxID=1526917 RepID=UPI0012FB07BF|nr:hypothetical protein [Chitinibacter sp. GC72]